MLEMLVLERQNFLRMIQGPPPPAEAQERRIITVLTYSQITEHDMDHPFMH